MYVKFFFHLYLCESIYLSEYLIILETDKDSESAVFNHFISLGIRPTFLDPDPTTIDRYVGIQDESIIVSKLISQSPKKQKGSLLSYAKLEKILVDILVDENNYTCTRDKNWVPSLKTHLKLLS